LQHRLEQTSQQVTIAKAAVAVLRKARMIRHRAVEPKPAKME
jgi:hypothetical protein